MAINSFSFLKNITVEPAVFLYTAVYVIMQSTMTNLLLQKKCRFNVTSLEPDLNTTCDDEKEGILFASEVISLSRLIMFSVCNALAILAMSWSDLAGRRRRPLFFLPLIGLIFQTLSGCFHSYFWNWPPLYAALTNMVFEMTSGSIVLMTLVPQTYLCDVTDTESRTMRLGLLTASRTLGDLLGYGSAGFILRSMGFFYTYVTCYVLSVLTLALGVIFVKDTSVQVGKKHFSQFFDVSRVKDSFKVVLNKNLPGSRIIVLILCVIFVLVIFTTQGEYSMQYLFLRLKFQWNEKDYSLYVVYRQIGIVIGSLFCSIVLSKILKVHDGLIGVFAGTWDTIAVIGYLIATQNWHIYLIPLFDVFHGTVTSVCISFFSKFYKADELGHLNSVLAVFGLFIPVCFPIYNAIFHATVDVFPSAYFLLSIALDIVIVLLYWMTYVLSKKKDESVKKPKIMADPLKH